VSPHTSSTEVELKLLVAPRDLALLQRHTLLRSATTGRVETLPLKSVYFDTPRFDLFHSGVSLRVRDGEDSRVQTLKMVGKRRAGLFERAELEGPVAGPEPDLTQLPAAVQKELGRLVDDRALTAQVTTFVRRTRRRLQHGSAEIQCDLDVGEISVELASGTRRFPLIELELELVDGQAAALYELALGLQSEVDLRVSTISKAARGFELATGLQRGPVKAGPVALGRKATLETVVANVVGAAIDQILANEQPAYDGDDPEGIHQMRVGVRRLRSALSLFKRFLPQEQRRRFAAELGWLGTELGDARDLDVFVERTLRPCIDGSERAVDPHLKRLLEVAQDERAVAYERARAAIDSTRYARLVLELGEWIATRAWRQQFVSEASVELLSPARPRARKLLEKRYRRVRRVARSASQLGSQERHALRIEVKKLRYASEFLSPLFRGDVRKWVKSLARVQKVLGDLNDDAQVERLLERLMRSLGAEAGGEYRQAAGFVAGWSARRAEVRLASLEGALSRLLRRAAEPFWR